MPGDRHLDQQARARLTGARVPAHRRDQAEVVEQRRPQVERQVADLLERLNRHVAQPGDDLARAGQVLAVHRLDAPLESDDQRRQRLAGLVVELAGDPLALLLLGRDDLGGQGREPAVLLGDDLVVALELIPEPVDRLGDLERVRVAAVEPRARAAVAGLEGRDRAAQLAERPEGAADPSQVTSALSASATTTSPTCIALVNSPRCTKRW